MIEVSEYKMRPGEYLDDKDFEALAQEYLDPNPIILDYRCEGIQRDGKKDRFGFGVEFMDPKEGLQKHDVDTFDDALKRVNDFLEAVTGRDAGLRKKDMKEST